MTEENAQEPVNIETPDGKIAKLKELIETVEADTPKGIEGNKQAARRARNALNEIKKLCTPLRQDIQEAVKK